MANNSIPTSYDPLVQALEDAADGAHTHGAAIGLVHNDEAPTRCAPVLDFCLFQRLVFS